MAQPKVMKNCGSGQTSWYKVTGANMPATLEQADQANAYTITDRATWLGFTSRKGLEIVVADDPRLIHQFGIVLVSPKKYSGVNDKAAALFMRWLGTEATQQAIAKFAINGEYPYVPNFGQRGDQDDDESKAAAGASGRQTE